MTDPSYTCAVWYMRYYNIEYELCATEEEAARFAVCLRDDSQGVPLGIQFADGRAVKSADWSFLDEVEELMRLEAADRVDRLRQETPPPSRKTRDPFDGNPLVVDLTEPSWLGQ